MRISERQPQYLFPAGAQFGSDNLVLRATARRHVVTEFAGPLSIKSVERGRWTPLWNWDLKARPHLPGCSEPAMVCPPRRTGKLARSGKQADKRSITL